MSYRLNEIPNRILKEFFSPLKISMDPQRILNCQGNLEKGKEKLMVPPGLISKYTPKWQ